MSSLFWKGMAFRFNGITVPLEGTSRAAKEYYRSAKGGNRDSRG